MNRRDIGTDDPRVHVRPGRGSRARTKVRPDYSALPIGTVTALDRGRYRVTLATETSEKTVLNCVKAKELPHRSVVIGDRVRVSGDISGREGTLARIVQIQQRISELRRSRDDSEGGAVERVMVANVTQMAIITALADPEPRPRMIDRCLVAAYSEGIQPLLVLTKSDLADATELMEAYEPLGVQALVVSVSDQTSIDRLRTRLAGEVTVMVGHSGVGKSTLVNLLVPDARRETGEVNSVTGRGRHTSTNARMFALPGSKRANTGAIIDTPGVRSFGLSHVNTADILAGFPDLQKAALECPKLCDHLSIGCALDTWAEDAQNSEPHARERLDSFRRLLRSRQG